MENTQNINTYSTPKPKHTSAWVYILIGVLWMGLTTYFPFSILTIVALNLLVILLISILQIFSTWVPPKELKFKTIRRQPFVSIHVPTYNEPPHLVIKTLQALKNLNYRNFEVVVVDNNTKDPDVWQPVENECRKLGRKFKFRHLDNVKGFKAGALNICYHLSNPNTEYILVIDADYQVRPELLKVALPYFEDDNVGLVQFPQAYYNIAQDNQGMRGEYDHFFDVYMQMANRMNCVLSTGTVSVIRKKALEQVNGWSSRSITEDCELGLRLNQAGYQGVYVPIPLGKGLMPTDLHALQVQRERWVFGNMQTLLCFFRLSKRKLCFWQCAGIFAQLTAWFNFLLIPILATFTGLVGYIYFNKEIYLDISTMGLGSIWFYLIYKFLFFAAVFRKRGDTFEVALEAYLVHLGMAWEGATSWIRCLCGENLRFKRTNKFLSLGSASKVVPNLLFSGILVLSGLLAVNLGFWNLAFPALIASPVFFSVLYLQRVTHSTYQFTEKLEKQQIEQIMPAKVA